MLLEFVKAEAPPAPTKAAGLDRMQDDFYQQMQKREQEYRERREALAIQRKSRGKSSQPFITVVEQSEPSMNREPTPKSGLLALKRV